MQGRDCSELAMRMAGRDPGLLQPLPPPTRRGTSSIRRRRWPGKQPEADMAVPRLVFDEITRVGVHVDRQHPGPRLIC
ncbi:hypothetical protein E2562_036815 [Oryza meyeriana var. granulata]|uniref:Uncharacterized protein n=1 Tax=Oryza meyeriana var. granulata TaxID=110450 RepID=A0A6G1E7U7_9ORYZ|nr:hypothetical protein E2562_036815 [Oryza meyeriana var. granulata]